jgi:O-Antigen ligase
MSSIAAERPASAERLHALTTAGLGLFVLTQCFTLPVLATGPSWTLWQSLPDLVLWLTGGSALLYLKAQGSPAQREVWLGLLYLGGMSVLAFGVLFIYNDPLLGTELRFGAFALYRIVQVLLVFWAASRLDYTPALLSRWRGLALVAFCVTCAGIITTAFTGAPIQFLSEYLPRGLGVSGPWEAYYRYQEPGLGFVGFNHGYAALQVMLLGALVLYLGERLDHLDGRRRGGEWVLLLALIASFLCNARAGLAGCLVFAALQLLRAPLRGALSVAGAGGLGLLVWGALAPTLSATTSRQATILDATDPNNLAGRTDIWQSIFSELLSDPARLLIGSGLGSTVINKGNNAHNMLLQVLFETGLVGVINMGAFFALLLTLLWRAGPRARVFLNVTIGFLLTSLTGETFFPNVAFGSFLPLYALVVALVLAPAPATRPSGTP